jgi:hypothetical protein
MKVKVIVNEVRKAGARGKEIGGVEVERWRLVYLGNLGSFTSWHVHKTLMM